MRDICTVKRSFNGDCGLPAIIMLKDLKAKTKKLFMCEDHFNMFCKSLIENNVPYESNTIFSGNKGSKKQEASKS